MNRLALPSCFLCLAVAGAAQAELTNTIVQVNATAAELEEDGYARVGSGPFISNPNGECAENGCVDFVGTSGALPNKGFFQFQFLDYQFNPTYYSGVFAILDINFSGSTITPQNFINQVNAQTGLTGVTALLANEASDAQNSSTFNEWLPNPLQSAIVFRWAETTPPNSPGLSQVYTFAWDLNDVTVFQNGLSLGGVYGVPAPGALALLGLAGLAGRRRR